MPALKVIIGAVDIVAARVQGLESLDCVKKFTRMLLWRKEGERNPFLVGGEVGS
jgi:hypothetical protein